jgi:hypothetical protein
MHCADSVAAVAGKYMLEVELKKKPPEEIRRPRSALTSESLLQR